MFVCVIGASVSGCRRQRAAESCVSRLNVCDRYALVGRALACFYTGENATPARYVGRRAGRKSFGRGTYAPAHVRAHRWSVPYAVSARRCARRRACVCVCSSTRAGVRVQVCECAGALYVRKHARFPRTPNAHRTNTERTPNTHRTRTERTPNAHRRCTATAAPPRPAVECPRAGSVAAVAARSVCSATRSRAVLARVPSARIDVSPDVRI